MSVKNIPFDIQTEIMQRLPVKSLVRFQLVSKQWKSLIDSPEFIKNHCRTIDTHYQHHLFALQAPDRDYTYHYTFKYLSIIDNDVYPDQKSSLLRSFRNIDKDYFTCGNSLLCFRGYADRSYFAVFWIPSVGKFVAIKIPNGLQVTDFIGFGFCSDTFDPKLVRIKINYDTHRWDVDVFTLSSRAWKRIYTGHKPVSDQCGVTLYHVCIKGCIYWRASDPSSGEYTNVIVSFDLKSEMFSKVCRSDRLLLARKLRVAEVNESLGVIEYDSDGGCGVWMMDFATKSFSKMFTVKAPGQLLYNGVLGFRKNGEVIIKAKDDNKYGLVAYEPSSGPLLFCYGNFRVKEIRNYIDDLFLPHQAAQTRWIKYIPIKVNIFAWRARQDCLPTRVNLIRRGITIESSLCPVCSVCEEDVCHIFFRCDLAQLVLRRICRWWGLDPHDWSSFQEWQSWILSIQFSSKYKHTHTHTQSLQRFACEDGRRVFSAIRIEQNYIKAQLQLMSSLLALLLQFEVLYLAMILEFK
ncbi:RNA-directed DNA polymerase, eukaryota [Tanacetum coccineum]